METRESQIKVSDIVAPIGVSSGRSIINYQSLLKEPEVIPGNPTKFEDVMVAYPHSPPGAGLIAAMCLSCLVLGFCAGRFMFESGNASDQRIDELTQEVLVYRAAINKAAGITRDEFEIRSRSENKK